MSESTQEPLVIDRHLIKITKRGKFHYLAETAHKTTICGEYFHSIFERQSAVGKHPVSKKRICKHCKQVINNHAASGQMVKLTPPNLVPVSTTEDDYDADLWNYNEDMWDEDYDNDLDFYGQRFKRKRGRK